MADCASIDPLVTPYVDDELVGVERDRVDRHLRVCPPCHARVAAERAVHDLVRERRTSLCGARASASLRSRCEGAARLPPRDRARETVARPLVSRLAPLALAAALVLIVGGAFVYQATEESARVMAAELTADHVKCFGIDAVLGTHQEAAAVESSMWSQFGWRLQLPRQLSRVGLELVGSRPCLYGEGKVAHLMYRHQGHPVSIFMLPRTVRPDEVVEVMGHEAVIWSAGGRTFVLIAREPRAEVEQMASVIQAALTENPSSLGTMTVGE